MAVAVTKVVVEMTNATSPEIRMVFYCLMSDFTVKFLSSIESYVYTFMQASITLIKKLHGLALPASILFTLLLLSSCAEWLPDAHRIDLQQGNTIKLEQVERLEIGMDKRDVLDIMGNPMLSDPFHNQRWDYIYRFIPGKGFERKSRLTLYFDNNKLKSIDESEYVEP